jgi:hypothetical protein
VHVRHYSGELGYSGKLLVEAHRRNPNSPYRKYTLFTTILGEGTSHGLGVMPNIDQAHEYLKEFPGGPFAGDVLEILGFFHDDLFKVLRSLAENEDARDYKYDCFTPYITRAPYESQMQNARSAALRYLRQAIEANPGSARNEYRRQVLEATASDDSQEWHWCAD